MFKKRTLALIIGVALVGALGLSFTACSGKKPAEEVGGRSTADEGGLTITGLDDFNGKYFYAHAFLEPEHGQIGGVSLWAANSRDEESGDMTLAKISGGSVTTKVWKSAWNVNEDKYTCTIYNGNDTVRFLRGGVLIMNGEKYNNTDISLTPVAGGNEMTVTFQNGVAHGMYKDDPDWNYGGEGSGPQDIPPPPELGEWTPTVDGFFFFGGVYLTAGVNADRDSRILYAPVSGETWTAATNTPFPKRKDYRITQIVRGDDTCVASGYQYAGPDSPPSDSVVAYTEDGINWKTANCPLPGNTQISGIASGNGRLVMIARSYSEVPDEGRYQSTERIAVSTDGVNWTLLTNDFTDTTDTRITFRSITYDWDLTKEESKFIIESQMWVPAEWGGWTSKENDIGTMVSTDGINWTKSWELSE